MQVRLVGEVWVNSNAKAGDVMMVFWDRDATSCWTFRKNRWSQGDLNKLREWGWQKLESK